MKTIWIFIVTVIILSRCDLIEEPYLRDTGNGTDTTGCPVPDFPSMGTPYKTVLIEDFTGHSCPNCPTAAKTAMEIADDYQHQVMILAVHAGFFALPSGGDFSAEYRTDAGEELNSFFAIPSYPNGMVNRKGYDQNHIVSPANWKTRVEDELALAPAVFLQVITDYDTASRKLCAHVKTNFLEDLSYGLKLSVFIMEDSIQSAQKNNDPLVGPTPVIYDYWHMHMLRASMNGTWGTTIASSDTVSSQGNSFITTLASILDNEWKAHHCRVLAFVYRIDNYEILQVAEARLEE